VTAATLVAQFQSRGIRLRMAGDVLQAAPRDRLTDADRASLRDHLAELKALVRAKASAALVDDVFGPGARVVSCGRPAVWPPDGGWIPSSEHTIDPYAAAAPTVPCPGCGAMMWGLAGSGWCCRRCHPDPLALCSESGTAELGDAILFELARRADFPPVPLARAVTVLPGESAWRRFAIAGSAADRATARATLRAMLNECQSGERGTPERTRV
jgi:hypothetical protein